MNVIKAKMNAVAGWAKRKCLLPSRAKASVKIDRAPARTPMSNNTDAMRPNWQTAYFSPERHARELLSWLTSTGVRGNIRARQMQELYREMARQRRWVTRSWNPVARQLTILLGNRKTYGWFTTRDGRHLRLRVYRIDGLPKTMGDTSIASSAVPAIKTS